MYSRVSGSAAAPTAGLHFTKELLEEVQAMGVNIGYVTLHVGLGTFRPVKEPVAPRPRVLIQGQQPGGVPLLQRRLGDQLRRELVVMVRPGKKLRTGAKVSFGEAGELTAEVVGEVEGGNRLGRPGHPPPWCG